MIKGKTLSKAVLVSVKYCLVTSNFIFMFVSRHICFEQAC